MEQLHQLYAAISQGEGAIRSAARQALANDVAWSVCHPINDLSNAHEVIEQFLLPLARSMPDLERRPFIQIPGHYEGAQWLAGTGYWVGTFTESLFGIPATGKGLYVRYSELLKVENQQISECYLFPDFLDVMRQIGCYPLQAPLGHPGLILPPMTLDGLCTGVTDPSESQSAVALVMDMLDCLRAYDGVTLESMALSSFWHPDFMWFGPGGIGATRGIDGFRRQHQGPFLTAFPDRDVDHHACTVAHGDYVATGGWPHMHGTHTGDGWLGLPASGKRLGLRVMDIWRREGALLKENWVAIDIPHMLLQMGIDVFKPLKTIKTR